MKFLADECCDTGLVLKLREEGFDVVYVQEVSPGISDEEVLNKAFQEKRILITEDKDFGNLVYRLKISAFGIVLLRFDPLESENKISRMVHIARHHKQKLEGNLLVVDSKKIRVKPLHL